MGAPKPLLQVDGKTFLEAAVEALLGGGCGEVVVVVADPEVADAAGRLPVITTHSPGPDAEQIDSLRLGLKSLTERSRAAVVLPVDHPLVAAETVARIIEVGRSHPDAVVRPTRGGAPGHPTLFPRSVWSRLSDPSLPMGARSVVESPDTRTVEVAVDDAGVLADIDTPAEYRRYVGGTP